MTLEEVFAIKDRRERIKVIKTLNDDNLLEEIYKNDIVWANKLQALLKIKDEKILASLYPHPVSDYLLRDEIISRVTDQKTLRDIALTEKYEDLRRMCIQKIHIKEYLRELCQKETSAKLIFILNQQIKEMSNTVSFLWEDD